ncbi:AAA family ATPase [Photobacterium sp. GB-72]|uniref:AAA family ATPase n=1 Tax=Photobacterium sp. GB-72 TaxID=2022105 RepID=UPI000D1722D8|nr:AAA family ATPase [Photobacterium sp. GB-72]PSV28104.1 hypothetical protein C9J40_19685 [Photobacterium sp. GB-72]
MLTKQVANLYGIDTKSEKFLAATTTIDFDEFGAATEYMWGNKLFIPKRPAVPINMVEIEYYSFEREFFSFFFNFLMTPNNSFAWLYGPSGTGKSSGPAQMCARLNWPFFEFNASKRTERIDLEGSYIPTPDGMEFFEGQLTKAITQGGVLLINEPSLMEASELAGLNDIKPGKPFFLASKNAEVMVHKNFRLVLADNTNGGGDGTMFGYVGTNRMNSAFLDRCRGFASKYMHEAEEHDMVINKLIHNYNKGEYLISQETFDKFLDELTTILLPLIEFAGAIRTEAESNQLSFPLTPRTVIDIAATMLQYRSAEPQEKLQRAIKECYLWQFSQDEKNKISTMFKVKFGIALNLAKAA